MSTRRGLAIVLLASCAGPAAPKPQPVSAAAAPAESAASSAPAVPAASPASGTSDPVCLQLAADGDPDGDAGDAADTPAATSDDATPESRHKHREQLTACSVARPNLTRDAAAILAARTHDRPLPRAVWDHKSRPARLDLIRRRFELAPDELTQLTRTGAVVPARLEQPSYAFAYHEIFQSQLPVYITADSLFHAIFASHDAIVQKLETDALAPALRGAFDRMHCGLAAAAADYPADTARDLDLYLTVAQRLAGNARARSVLGEAATNAQADDLVARVRAAAGAATLTLFGRLRIIDFTAYTPRGHYTKSEELTGYFLAAMWASRIELNLVSRSSRSSAPGPEPDPSETPREAIDALALADLADRSAAAASLATVDQAWTLLAGRREDVTLDDLARLRRTAGITSLHDAQAFAQLKRAIGDGYQRTTRLHPMPEGSRVLPAIATLIGPRVVSDAQALMPVVNSAVPGRNTVHTADVVYSLGLDRGKRYLAKDLAAFPALGGQLEVARTIARTTRLGDDLYGAWYAAIRALAVPPAGAVPSFLTGEVGADLRFNTMAAAYGQLKHNYVLMAGQPYSEFGCEIPDGYVEPVPAAYDALIDYARRGGKVAALVDPQGRTGARAHFDRVVDTLRVIRAIVDDELANRPLTAREKRWLGMVSELSVDRSEDITGFPPVYSGWYFDLFPDAEADGMRGASYIADYFTSVSDGISYAGATAPRLGIFVVDTGGAPRAFVGPVARAYETHTPLATRLTDDDPPPSFEDPWAASYTVASPAARPALALRYDRETGHVVVKTAGRLGTATIKILDHHRVAIAAKTQPLDDGETEFEFPKTARVGAVYIAIGGFRDWVVGDSYDEIAAEWGKLPDGNGSGE